MICHWEHSRISAIKWTEKSHVKGRKIEGLDVCDSINILKVAIPLKWVIILAPPCQGS